MSCRCTRSSSLSVLVDLVFCKLREGLVGLLFLGERCLQQLHSLIQAELRGPRLQRTVAGDLIVLDGLGSCEETGVQGGRL